MRDDELARLAGTLTDLRVRDTVVPLAVSESEPAAQADALWAMLARTLPEPARVEALILLAISAYGCGAGPLAGIVLETALRANPNQRLADSIDPALQAGTRPELIRELAATGYQLAGRLGVQLPPRQAFADSTG